MVMAGDLGHDGREAEAREVGNRRAHAAGHQAEPPAATEQVDTKAGLIAVRIGEDDVGEVDAAGVFRDGLAARQKRKHEPFHLVTGQRRKLHLQHTGEPHGGGHATNL